MTYKALREEIENYFEVQNKEYQVFRNISPEDLIKQPAKGKWSIIECIEHLNLTFDHYLPQIEKGFSKVKLNGSVKDHYKVKMMAGMMINGLKPKEQGKIGMKMKTFKVTTPTSDLNVDEVLSKFKEGYGKFQEYYKSTEDQHFTSVKVISLIGKLLTFQLGDAYLFLLAHQERHFQQIKNVINTLQIRTDNTENV
ncbi:MAG: DinB family protein [bacterium]|nr:DinB family protein [bacterium]